MSKPIDQELLPCPFCGGDQVALVSKDHCAFVQCESEKCQADGPVYTPDDGDFVALAATSWNRRAAVQPASVAVPEAWKLVPVEPTDHMTWVGQSMRPDTEISIGAIYAAMLAAAPHPVSGEQRDDR